MPGRTGGGTRGHLHLLRGMHPRPTIREPSFARISGHPMVAREELRTAGRGGGVARTRCLDPKSHGGSVLQLGRSYDEFRLGLRPDVNLELELEAR
jgi:hypothetical protein